MMWWSLRMQESATDLTWAGRLTKLSLSSICQYLFCILIRVWHRFWFPFWCSKPAFLTLVLRTSPLPADQSSLSCNPRSLSRLAHSSCSYQQLVNTLRCLCTGATQIYRSLVNWRKSKSNKPRFDSKPKGIKLKTCFSLSFRFFIDV